MRAEFLIFQNEFEQAEKVAREILTYSENKEDLSQAYRILAKSIYYKSLPIIYNLGEIFELIDENFDSSSRGPFSEELNISEFNSNISEFISLLDATPEIFSEVEEGRKLINKSIQLSENNAESWYLRGCFERILGEDASQAIKSMERAVSLQPDNPIYWEELGQLYEGEANYRKAKEAYLKYYDLEIQPRELLIDSEDFLNLVLDVSEFSLALEVEESPFDGFKFEIKEALERSEIENSPDNLPPPSPISPGKAELEILPDGSSLVKMTLYQKNIEGMFHLDMDEEELISIIEDILLTIWNEFISSLELTGENSNVYDVWYFLNWDIGRDNAPMSAM